MVAKEKKDAYFTHLTECLNKYQRAFIVHADFVGSKQISDIRIALRGKAELVFGKNTMVRRCIRDLTSDGSHPEWAAIVPVMKGNLGFMFTNGDLGELQTVVDEYVKPAAAKAGVIAPCECIVPKGATGLDPAQTSFFQALNIATKINKGSIEIINDCKVLFEGVKVGTSEAALLTKMGIKPFKYGLTVSFVWDGGVFDPSVMRISEETLMGKFMAATGNVAAVCLATGFHTQASYPHVMMNAIMNATAVAAEAGYTEFDAAAKVADFIKDPAAYAAKCGGGGGGGGGGAAAAPAAAKGGKAAPAAAAAPEPEEEEEESAFDLFD